MLRIKFSIMLIVLLVSTLKAQVASMEIRNAKVHKLDDGNLLIYGYGGKKIEDKLVFKVYLYKNDLQLLGSGEALVKYILNPYFYKRENGNYYFTPSADLGNGNHCSRIVFDKNLKLIENHDQLDSKSDVHSRINKEKEYIKITNTIKSPSSDFGPIYNVNADLVGFGQNTIEIGDYKVYARSEQDFSCATQKNEGPATLVISKILRVDNGFEIATKIEKTILIDEEFGRVDIRYPGNGDYIYVFTSQFAGGTAKTAYGILRKMNFKTGSTSFEKRIELANSLVFDAKISFTDNEIVVSGNFTEYKTLNQNDFKFFYFRAFDTTTGEIKASKNFKYEELSSDYLDEKSNSSLQIYNLKKQNGKYSFFATYGITKVLVPAQSAGPAMKPAPYVEFTTQYYSYIELDSKLNKTMCQNLKVQELVEKNLTERSPFLDNYYNIDNSSLGFLFHESGEKKIVGRKGNQLFIKSIEPSTDFMKQNKIKYTFYFLINHESAYEFGQTKDYLYLQIKKF